MQFLYLNYSFFIYILQGVIFLIFIMFSVFMCMLGAIIFPSEVIASGNDAINLCLTRVAPSLFPFFVLQSLAIGTGITDFFTRALSPFGKYIFKTSDISPFVLGIIGGYPVGFKSVVSLYENKKISKEKAEKMCAYCNNAGPAFIIGYVGVCVLKSAEIGYIILASHILSSIIVGFLFNIFEKYEPKKTQKVIKKEPFVKLFIESVNNGFSGVLSVCGFVIFFNILAKILTCFNVFSTISGILYPFLSNLGFEKSMIEAFFIGLLEMSNGINMIDSGNMQNKIIIISFLLAFASISIHFQTMNFNKGLKLSWYFKGKILQSFISPIISLTIYNYINTNITTFNAINTASYDYLYIKTTTFVCVLMMGIIFIKYLLNNCKKNKNRV